MYVTVNMQLVFRFVLKRAVIDTTISVVELTHPPPPPPPPPIFLEKQSERICIQGCKILNDARALLEACCIA